MNSVLSNAQPTTAMDFSMTDCNGQVHTLYSELDSGNAIIMEFWMNNCQSCVDAGSVLEVMYQNLKPTCGNNVRYFQTAFNNAELCHDINTWVATNGFSSVPFDSGAAQVAYYGSFGMPTVAVAAGNTHQLLYLSTQGLPVNDTSIIATAIRNYCTTGAGVSENDFQNSVIVSPNPTSGVFNVQTRLPDGQVSKFQNPPAAWAGVQMNSIEVYNVFGECIHQHISTSSHQQIDLREASDGIYFLKINTEQGFIRKKIVVAK
ncbi:MAG: T9SS type A sorting domain-containing protein [Bacteroidetes bacterium]|nr:T9SS type A sorting domain-containing protein [Bacteroidota bacterium]